MAHQHMPKIIQGPCKNPPSTPPPPFPPATYFMYGSLTQNLATALNMDTSPTNGEH